MLITSQEQGGVTDAHSILYLFIWGIFGEKFGLFGLGLAFFFFDVWVISLAFNG